MQATLCIVYVSEAVNVSILQQLIGNIEACVRAKLVHSFKDTTYNRTSFYLVGRSKEMIVPVLSLCREAFQK